MNNSQVAQRFWDNSDRPCSSRSLSYDGSKLFSYGTCILQRLGNYVIGNGSSYSHTTSAHQSTARVHDADVVLHGIPRGRYDLLCSARELHSRLEAILKGG